MPPSKILDTHIHLWPSTAISPTDHAWMTPGHQLAKRHGIADYNAATSRSPTQPSGFIYVETDRYLPSTLPSISASSSEAEKAQKLKEWAKEPLQELDFLRRIVKGEPQDGDGFSAEDSTKMLEMVIWAPFHLPPDLFSLYLKIAEDTLQAEAWGRVVGFRYLLQGKGVQHVKSLVESEDWIRNLVGLGEGRGGKGWAFDVGIDCHRDGVECLDAVEGMIERVRKEEGNGKGNGGVRFVLNHLTKPSLPSTTWPSFPHYSTLLTRLAADPRVYMKLSGAFNEFSLPPTPSTTPSSTSELLTALRPYLDLVFKVFGPGRVMFGSDWPVCNVGGPKGEQENWGLWREVVEQWVDGDEGLKGGGEGVWWGAGKEAYALEGI